MVEVVVVDVMVEGVFDVVLVVDEEVEKLGEVFFADVAIPIISVAFSDKLVVIVVEVVVVDVMVERVFLVILVVDIEVE